MSIALDKQHHVYAFDTACFYTDKERLWNDKLDKTRAILHRRKLVLENGAIHREIVASQVARLNELVKYFKAKLLAEIESNIGLTRTVRPEALTERNVVSIFSSELTRCLEMPVNELSDNLVIVKVYYFGVAESVVTNGFEMNGERYVFFSASAGQIRTKKFVAVKQSAYERCWNTLACGLTVDRINEVGGINVNKYLAYLALSNSATDVWADFDIDRCICVDDFESSVYGAVDFIDDETYTIERREMEVPITHTDGCGMILPQLKRRNFMCRLPWIKGLLAPFPFDKFLERVSGSTSVVTDIWGKEHDVLAENIQVIFTKSQFKMWKFYESWDAYKDAFKRYGCRAGVCNEEEYYIEDAHFNYQMMQTLHDLTEEELEHICERTNRTLTNITSDRRTMLRVFGVTPRKHNLTAFQECLRIYPELLQDPYTAETLRDIRRRIEKNALAAKLEIDGKYLFIIPDLYAFCEYLFLRRAPNECVGLLADGEVYARVYRDRERLDCLRSPHLYMEHAVRENVASDRDMSEWFTTDGIYTSCHDLISKILMFDCDGDKSLVCADPVIIEAAIRCSDGVVPLYYNMKKAISKKIDAAAMYEGMAAAYRGGNIGGISNAISKCWNLPEPRLDTIKLLCAETNFTIDYAKTLYKPTRPTPVDTKMRADTGGKLPHFFVYAKDKTEAQVARPNGSCVNRLERIVKRRKLNFDRRNLGTFDYKMLMHDPECTEINPAIVTVYDDLAAKVKTRVVADRDNTNGAYVFSQILFELLEAEPDIVLLTDQLVLHLFREKQTKRKVVFWNCFGDIVLENLRRNVDDAMVMCEDCGRRFRPATSLQVRCPVCQAEYRKRTNRENMRRNYSESAKNSAVSDGNGVLKQV